MSRRWLLAIDFGTTSTAAAALVDGDGRSLPLEGQPRLPSTVVLANDRVLVGIEAERLRVAHASAAEPNPKRFLGVREHLLLGGQPLRTDEAVGRVLAHVYELAVTEQGGQSPEATVLTHPARWGAERIDGLRSAAGHASLPEVSFVPEPVGAALHYGRARVAIDDHVAVYDLGGGTFDTAVLRRTTAGFELAGPPGGDDRIGGEDFDQRVAERLLDQLGADDPDAARALRESPDPQWRNAAAGVLVEARRAKEALSRQTAYDIQLPPPLSRQVRITRPEFETMIRSDVAATVAEFLATIDRAGLDHGDLSGGYLAGGASRIPLVSRLLHEALDEPPATYDDPKAVVALGALHAPSLREVATPGLEGEEAGEGDHASEAAGRSSDAPDGVPAVAAEVDGETSPTVEPGLPSPPTDAEPEEGDLPPPPVDAEPEEPERPSRSSDGDTPTWFGVDHRTVLVGVGASALVVLLILVVALSAGGGDGGGDDGSDGGADGPKYGVDATIEIGAGNKWVATGNGGTWVARDQSDEGVLNLIDDHDNQVGAPVDLPAPPSGVAVGEGAVWVTHPTAGTLTKVDPVDYEILDTFELGDAPRAVAVGAGSVWVVDSDSGTLLRVDPTSGAVIETTPVGAGPWDVCVAQGHVWVANFLDDTVTRLDPGSGDLKTIPVGVGPHILSCAAGQVWVANQADMTLNAIDAADGSAESTVSLDAQPWGLAQDDEDLWVSLQAAHEIVVLDAGSGDRRSRIDVGAGAGPGPITVGHGSAWVANQGATSVLRLGPD